MFPAKTSCAALRAAVSLLAVRLCTFCRSMNVLSSRGCCGDLAELARAIESLSLLHLHAGFLLGLVAIGSHEKRTCCQLLRASMRVDYFISSSRKCAAPRISCYSAVFLVCSLPQIHSPFRRMIWEVTDGNLHLLCVPRSS